MASTTLARAASFSSGATASSRSRNVMSAGRLGAFPSIFSLDPGTERHERRGRSRLRADMSAMLGGVPAPPPSPLGGDHDEDQHRSGRNQVHPPVAAPLRKV